MLFIQGVEHLCPAGFKTITYYHSQKPICLWVVEFFQKSGNPTLTVTVEFFQKTPRPGLQKQTNGDQNSFSHGSSTRI